MSNECIKCIKHIADLKKKVLNNVVDYYIYVYNFILDVIIELNKMSASKD